MADDNKDHDERPRPKFGELAPEGWVWHPPKDADRLDTAHPAPEAHAAHPSAPTRSHEEELLAQAAGEHPVPTWNQPVTILLLIVGIIGMFLSIGTIASTPASIQHLYANEGLGAYKPAASVSMIMLAGEISMVGIWLLSAVLSVFRLTRHRLAFYIPILGGVLAFIGLFVCLTAIIASDPTLLDFYSRLSG
ncbi:DUF6264 family protein [Diaminobutyricibacter sp. McL0608]|uniref:DUF6264 family protein n=1 Tax=Leifsonia sp. McL0608 TaxID=3143537 RepID=UPI0031F2F01E